MRFLPLLLAASWAMTAEVLATFTLTCNTVNSQMATLHNSITFLKQAAVELGHKRIALKCDVAHHYLGKAQIAWGKIMVDFSTSPWRARYSPHAAIVKLGLTVCGTALDWIYLQPELRHPRYIPHTRACKNNYSWCNSGCKKVWDWPTPPGYTPPKPSQGNSGYGRRIKRSDSVCPVNESACPISNGSKGFECIDTQTELTSCGGCVTQGEGENCLSIEGAEGVGCFKGGCVVLSLKPGYVKDVMGRPMPAHV